MRAPLQDVRYAFIVLAASVLLIGCGLQGPPENPLQPSLPLTYDIWLYGADAEGLERLTTASGPGRESMGASVSDDGNRIVFYSDSDFLDEGLPNGTDEIWLYTVGRQELTRITAASDPQRDSRNPIISPDGGRIVFESDSDLLDEGLPAGRHQIWLYTIASGQFQLLTEPLDGASGGASIDADGSMVAFHRDGAIWLLNISSGEEIRISPDDGSSASSPAISRNGNRVAFEVDGGIGLYDIQASALEMIATQTEPTRESEAPSINADGTRVVFHSDDDLLGDGRPDSVDEIWLFEVESRSLHRITSTWETGQQIEANPVLQPDSANPKITADGTQIVFASDADFLNEGLPNGYPHLWLYDVSDQALARIDTSRGSGTGPAINRDASTIVLFGSEFDFIRRARIAAGTTEPRPTTLTADEISGDLEAFQNELEGRWAYLKTTGVDYRTLIGSVRDRAVEGMSSEEYALELQRIISMFIDGHAAVGGVRYPEGYLPFLIEPSGDRFVAFLPDRSGFLDDGFPHIRRIDGRPILEWITAAIPFSPKGSSQYQMRHALRQIRYLQFQRGVMGLPQGDTVNVELASADADTTLELSLTVAAQGPVYGIWPDTESGIIDGNVCYLRLEAMNGGAVDEVLSWMPRFRETRGLIVDVRGNGGGSRDALRALFPYVMTSDADPLVVNAAVYCLHPDYPTDHLGGSRYMYRENWPGWSPAERGAIARFKRTFTPEWTPPDEEFSQWHYLVMSRETNPAAFYYGKPVIVLLDAKSFSATDIFVSAFKGYPLVPLMGSPQRRRKCPSGWISASSLEAVTRPRLDGVIPGHRPPARR